MLVHSHHGFCSNKKINTTKFLNYSRLKREKIMTQKTHIIVDQIHSSLYSKSYNYLINQNSYIVIILS